MEQKIFKKKMILAGLLMGIALVVLLLFWIGYRQSRQEEGMIASGICGDRLTWQISKDGKLTISGTGRMNDYSGSESGGFSTDAPWFSYSAMVYVLEIEEGVTIVGDYAFSGMSSLQTVRLGNTVTDLGIYAFSPCEKLEKVTLSSRLETIGDYAFYGDSALTSLSFPDGLLRIGEGAFGKCGLETISLPGSLTSTGRYAFYACTSLTSCVLGAGIVEISDYTFSECSALSTVDLPVELQTVGKYAFYNCSSLSSLEYQGDADDWKQVSIGDGNGWILLQEEKE